MLSFKQSTIIFALLILFFTCLSIVNAAIISGSIYDLSLQKESDVVVEINTVPKQMMVSKDGDYSFNINQGKYTLYAHTFSSEATESVIVSDDGNYTLDIILEEKLTDLSANGDFALTESDINVSTDTLDGPSAKNLALALTLGLILIILLAIVIVYMLIYSKKIKSLKNELKNELKHEHKSESSLKSEKATELDEHAHKLLQFIKKEKRTTQKDLRKEVPLSEAKISLIISDLEDKGKIRKIKKGRGNILIFVKD